MLSPGFGRNRIARGASPERYADNARPFFTSQGRTARGVAPSGAALEVERSNGLIHDLGAHSLVLTIFFIILMQIFR